MRTLLSVLVIFISNEASAFPSGIWEGDISYRVSNGSGRKHCLVEIESSRGELKIISNENCLYGVEPRSRYRIGYNGDLFNRRGDYVGSISKDSIVLGFHHSIQSKTGWPADWDLVFNLDANSLRIAEDFIFEYEYHSSGLIRKLE